MNLLSRLFSFQGRINRTEYALIMLIGYVLPSFFMFSLNKSGDYCWAILVPVVGVLALFALLFFPGDKSKNQFG